MKNLFSKFLMAIVVMLGAVCTANAGVVGTWGDLTFVDQIIEVDAWLFDTGNTNPAGFPAPVAVGVNGTWVPADPSRVSVGTLRSFYQSEGCPDNTIAFKLVISGGSTRFSEIKVNIDGVAAQSGAGTFTIGPGVFGILTGIDLTSFASTDKIRVQYTAPMGSANIVEMKFACVPEPVSMAFLGTGFLGVICARLRRKRR